MKTCKKCKRKVPNNMKICKYCGADLSKIKPSSNKNSKNNQKVTKEKEKKDVLEKKEIKDTFETEILETKIYDKKLIEDDKTEVLDFNINEEINKKEILTKKDDETEALEASSFNIFGSSNDKEKVNKQATKATQIYLAKRKLFLNKVRNACFVIFIILVVGFVIYKSNDFYKSAGHVVEGNEKLKDVTFKMNEIVTYKDVHFTILSVTSSNGTAYKKPKEGNKFLIVNMRIENEKNNKYHYSGKYFKMGTDNDQVERIISPVNAGSDLYSGDLVVGGTKEGSVVFEQPIDAKGIYLYYYDSVEFENYQEYLTNKGNNLEEVDTTEEIEQEETKEVKEPLPKFRIKIDNIVGTSN